MGNICDRRLWRIKEASVGAAVDFVRRFKPHKQNRDTARGQQVARRRRDGRRESNKHQTFIISPSVIFQKKNDSSLVRGSLWRTVAPMSLWSHKISRPEQLCSGRGLLLLYFTLFLPFRYRGQEPFGEPLQASLT